MEFRRVVALALIVGCVGGAEPGARDLALAAPAARRVAGAQQLPAAAGLTISGTVFKSDRATPVADVRLRLRNLDTGTIIGNAVSDKQGAFSFAVPGPGRYVVEAVGKTGGVVAVSDPVSLAGSAVSTNVILPSDKSAATALLLVAIAGGAGLVGWIVGSEGTTSPER